MPDGGLPEWESQLEADLLEVVSDVQPDRIFTSGATGYDGHPDHIAVHTAALRVASRIWRLGGEVTVLALMADHSGTLRVGADVARKTGAMACHVSARIVADLSRWGDTDLYTPLIVGGETYTCISSDATTAFDVSRAMTPLH